MQSENSSQQRGRFVEDLLAYMTLEEKLGQLDLFHSCDDPGVERAITAGRIGGVAGAVAPARFQALAVGRSRLGIPLLLSPDTVDTVLSPWALAASWDDEVARSVGARAASNAIGDGQNCIRAPGIGRHGQGGESARHLATCEPRLAARLTTAFVQGAKGAADDHRGAVLALPTWQTASDGDALAWSLGVLHADGVGAIDCAALDPTTAQRAGFSGMLVAECRRILSLVTHHFASTRARSALEAAEQIIAGGLVSEVEIDMAVRGVLAAKHAIGLFRDPQRIVAPPATGVDYGRDEHRVRGTFVLLRNEAGLLPFSPVSDRVLVVGAPEGAGGLCSDALGRAGIGHAVAPGLAQRRDQESWVEQVPGDHFALSLTRDAARRADFVLVALDDHHFAASRDTGWRQPTSAALAMLQGLSLTGTRLVAIIATGEPVDLAGADQYFAAVLQCWRPTAGFEEALSDVLSGRFSPHGRMPVSAGRYLSGHGLGFGESVVSAYTLAAQSDHLSATVRVRNAGIFRLRETVQVYVRGGDGSLRLADFAHVSLEPGDEAPVSFMLGLDALGTPGANKLLELRPGRHEILVGKSSGRLLSAAVEITPALARAITLNEPGFLRLASG